MREIKFRAKHQYNRNWVYGYYLTEETPDGTRHMICVKENGLLHFPTVDPRTVGEYVDEWDYYEGDIIETITEKFFGVNKMDYSYHGIVVFKNSSFQIHCIEDNHYYPLDKFTGSTVGNIYENPELLQG